ncbi:Dehydration-responsive element-binding protein 1E [Apostasia shenzhenica]|uniref:Dehydration-responsive element-binding protein 1E n=1 Tax=Apostasia shenzhenica TaxID=1088818 RepID=A0A2I0AZ59_9ASPA|nr:Dehydration-responsive element-binding protein 1E [Apostasia shenzhenica]
MNRASTDDPLPASPPDELYATVLSAPPKRPAGRTKFRETRHPVYKGVRLRGARRWVCEVREPNKKSRIWLGTFPTAEMAARAHDVAALALRGSAACLNFADSARLLPIPPSPASPRTIRLAAAQAAESFRPGVPLSTTGGAARGGCGGSFREEGCEAAPGAFAAEVGVDYHCSYSVMDFDWYYYDEEPMFFPAATAAAVDWDDGECREDVPLWSHSI